MRLSNMVPKKLPEQPVRSRIAQPLEGEKQKLVNKVRVSKSIFIALSIVSIIGFLDIIGTSFFEFRAEYYVEALLMIIIGVAFILEADIPDLRSLAKGFNQKNFSELITTVVGLVAIIAGIFSFPWIRYEHAVFHAIKGILALMAIVIITIQTWIVE